MTANPADSAGPVAARVLALVADHTGHALRATAAERSPLGPRVIRLEPTRRGNTTGDDRLRSIGAWLKAQSWVDAVAIRPTHLYIRVKTEVLSAWVASAFGSGASPSHKQSCGRRMVVRFLCSGDDLDLARQRRVAEAVRSTLTERGLSVALDPVERDANGDYPATEDVIVVGDAPAPERRKAIRLPVAPVDVRHGVLRARHGGQLNVQDLLDEARHRDTAAAEVVLAMLLMCAPRTRRIGIDENSLDRESTWLASLASLVDGSRSAPSDGRAVHPPPASESARRDLAFALETLPAVASRCATELEPAHAYRYLRSLTHVAASASAHVAIEDPLWAAAVLAIGRSLGLLGLAFDTPVDRPFPSTTFDS